MSQLHLNLLVRIDGPSVVPQSEIEKLSDEREAVRKCWAHRRVMGMTRTSLAEQTGMRPSHIVHYLSVETHDENGKKLRSMPSKYFKAFQAVAGNTFVSQFHASEQGLTILEAMIADRKVA